MKVVVDANVIFSALYRPGSVPDALFVHGARETLLLYAPDSVLAEARRALVEHLGFDAAKSEHVLALLPVAWIPRVEYAVFLPDALAAIRDPDDAPLIAVAILVGGDVVSGDRAFHPLRSLIVRTWTPRALFDHLGERGIPKNPASSPIGSAVSRGRKSGGKPRA